MAGDAADVEVRQGTIGWQDASLTNCGKFYPTTAKDSLGWLE